MEMTDALRCAFDDGTITAAKDYVAALKSRGSADEAHGAAPGDRRRRLAVLLAGTGRAAAWNPLESAGKELGAGAVEAIQPALAATIDHTFASGHELVADVDRRLSAQHGSGGTLVGKVLADADKDVQARIAQVDAQPRAAHRPDRPGRERRGERSGRPHQAGHRQGGRCPAEAGPADRRRAPGRAVRRGSRSSSSASTSWTRRSASGLGNVDVIATKQRLAIEETLLRVAVLVGLVAFVVIVLVRLWRRYGEIVEEAARAENRRPAGRELAAGLVSSLGLQAGRGGGGGGDPAGPLPTAPPRRDPEGQRPGRATRERAGGEPSHLRVRAGALPRLAARVAARRRCAALSGAGGEGGSDARRARAPDAAVERDRGSLAPLSSG